MPGELIRMKDAQERLGMAKNTFRKFVQKRGITIFENPRDAREKLVDWSEIEESLKPRPIRRDQGGAGKASALGVAPEEPAPAPQSSTREITVQIQRNPPITREIPVQIQRNPPVTRTVGFTRSEKQKPWPPE